MIQFKKATKKAAKLRIALCGPTGSGKTYTSLRMGCALGERVAVIDTERGSASLYSDEFDFDVLELTNHHPENYIQAIEAAENGGYEVIIIDSLTHAWTGKDGALELKDKAARRSNDNDFTAWRHITPLHNQLVDAMLGCKMHLIATMRTKMEYVIEDVKGKKVPKKVGMAPVQRDGMAYEFTLCADIDEDHTFLVSKTRCRKLDQYAVTKAGEKEAKILLDWINDGEPEPTPFEKAVDAFREFGTTKEEILKWLQKEEEGVGDSEIRMLQNTWRGIKDGKINPADLFGAEVS